MGKSRYYIIFLFALWVSVISSQAQTDSLYIELDSTTFMSHRHSSALRARTGGALELDMEGIRDFPQILGNADPLNMLKYFSGVQTSSEYDSGVHIQGCDNAHNDISLGGVPIYGASHLLGLFSIFNPSHYTRMSFSHSPAGASVSNRLGGAIHMELPDTLDRNVRGDISLGIMTSQGTLSLKLGQNSFLHLSARQSYLNLLYKRWLKIGGNPMRYGFGDYNVTYFIRAGQKDHIWADAYYGRDNAFLGAGNYNVDLSAGWGNLTAALHWEHLGDGFKMRNSAFASGYAVDASLKQINSDLEMPSSIASAGYKGKIMWGDLVSGADITVYKVKPQAPYRNISGNEMSSTEIQKALEADIYSDYSHTFDSGLSFDIGLKSMAYLSPEKEWFFSLSPNLSLSYNAWQKGRYHLSYSLRHQNLFQTGLTNIGLPIEFWFMAGKYSRPQSAHSFAFGYDVDFYGDMFRLDVDIYHKILSNQVEYDGDLFELINSEYDLDRFLLKGDGYNYGLSLMLHKQAGKFTGWMSYSFGRALRTFDDPAYPGVYPASHERIHEFKALCSYEYGKWDFTATAICASGTPFTPPESFYLSDGILITKFGEYNSARLRPYIRADLSVSRTFRKDDRCENGINFSIYNALARKNEVMWRLSADDGKFTYQPLSFFMRFMPSVSYYHKF